MEPDIAGGGREGKGGKDLARCPRLEAADLKERRGGFRKTGLSSKLEHDEVAQGSE